MVYFRHVCLVKSAKEFLKVHVSDFHQDVQNVSFHRNVWLFFFFFKQNPQISQMFSFQLLLRANRSNSVAMAVTRQKAFGSSHQIKGSNLF